MRPRGEQIGLLLFVEAGDSVADLVVNAVVDALIVTILPQRLPDHHDVSPNSRRSWRCLPAQVGHVHHPLLRQRADPLSHTLLCVRTGLRGGPHHARGLALLVAVVALGALERRLAFIVRQTLFLRRKAHLAEVLVHLVVAVVVQAVAVQLFGSIEAVHETIAAVPLLVFRIAKGRRIDTDPDAFAVARGRELFVGFSVTVVVQPVATRFATHFEVGDTVVGAQPLILETELLPRPGADALVEAPGVSRVFARLHHIDLLEGRFIHGKIRSFPAHLVRRGHVATAVVNQNVPGLNVGHIHRADIPHTTPPCAVRTVTVGRQRLGGSAGNHRNHHHQRHYLLDVLQYHSHLLSHLG